jgi:type IV secretion system protein TrbB
MRQMPKTPRRDFCETTGHRISERRGVRPVRDEADERGITLSRYIKERLFQSDGGGGLTFSDAQLAAAEKRIIEAGRISATQSLKPVAQQLTTLLAMLDQFALSMLSHLPEIPEPQRKSALASGARRHRGWRAEVEETLKQMEPPQPSRKKGVHRKRRTRMIAPQQVQEQRLHELLRRQLGPRILAAISDPQITEIIVNEDGRVWFESYGKGMHEAGLTLAASQIESLIGTVAASLGSVANPDSPIVEGELSIGRIRFEGLLPPVARKPCCVMRKPAQVLYTIDDYVRDGILSEAHAEVFRSTIDERRNIVIAGGTGSGKTTLAGALINEMVSRSDPNERYVIIEDTLEIQCRARNLVQLHTAESADMTRLVRTTMRLRPDRIIIGEVRGAEALALLKAWNTGHPGGVTTIHANSARAALTRLSSLVQEAGVPPQPELIAETIKLLVFIVRTPAGRRVKEMVRVEGYDARDGFNLTPVEAV